MTETTIVLRGPGVQAARHLDIQIAVEATVNVDSQTARRRVTGWLLNEVGNMLVAGVPRLVIGTKTVWRVPAILTSSERGPVGEVGLVDVDAETGIPLTDDKLRDYIVNNVQQIVRSTPSPVR